MIIGTCSLCGGYVDLPDPFPWAPPESNVPRCLLCHAKQKLPTIQMEVDSKGYKNPFDWNKRQETKKTGTK